MGAAAEKQLNLAVDGGRRPKRFKWPHWEVDFQEEVAFGNLLQEHRDRVCLVHAESPLPAQGQAYHSRAIHVY